MVSITWEIHAICSQAEKLLGPRYKKIVRELD